MQTLWALEDVRAVTNAHCVRGVEKLYGCMTSAEDGSSVGVRKSFGLIDIVLHTRYKFLICALWYSVHLLYRFGNVDLS